MSFNSNISSIFNQIKNAIYSGYETCNHACSDMADRIRKVFQNFQTSFLNCFNHLRKLSSLKIGLFPTTHSLKKEGAPQQIKETHAEFVQRVYGANMSDSISLEWKGGETEALEVCQLAYKKFTSELERDMARWKRSEPDEDVGLTQTEIDDRLKQTKEVVQRAQDFEPLTAQEAQGLLSKLYEQHLSCDVNKRVKEELEPRGFNQRIVDIIRGPNSKTQDSKILETRRRFAGDWTAALLEVLKEKKYIFDYTVLGNGKIRVQM